MTKPQERILFVRNNRVKKKKKKICPRKINWSTFSTGICSPRKIFLP